MIDPRRVNPDDAAKRRLDSRAAVPIPTGPQASALNFTNPTQFWNHFSAAMNENPPLAETDLRVSAFAHGSRCVTSSASSSGWYAPRRGKRRANGKEPDGRK